MIVGEPDRSFTEQTEVRFDISVFGGTSFPKDVTVYSRSVPGIGSFCALPPSDDASTDEIVVTTGDFRKLVSTRNNKLPVEVARFNGTATDSGTCLTWTMASETNSADFAV